MRRALLLSVLLAASASVVLARSAEPAAHAGGPTTVPTSGKTSWVAFGDPMKLKDADNIDAGTVLADAAKYDGKSIRLVGEVHSVCKKKGCWLRMNSGGTPLTVFVKFTCPIDGNRLIPLEAVGRPVKVEGTFAIVEIDEDEAKHQAEDAGATEAEVEAIKGPTKIIEMQGPSALVELPTAK
jgi:hypothetical protein